MRTLSTNGHAFVGDETAIAVRPGAGLLVFDAGGRGLAVTFWNPASVDRAIAALVEIRDAMNRPTGCAVAVGSGGEGR